MTQRPDGVDGWSLPAEACELSRAEELAFAGAVRAAYPGDPAIQRELLAYLVCEPTEGRVCVDCGTRFAPHTHGGLVCTRCKHARSRLSRVT